MVGFIPNETLPSRWSLDPDDTLSLVFWTKDPTSLIRDQERLRPYNVQVHVTVTGWSEVEHGAPDLGRGMERLGRTIDAFGVDNVIWRFSPVPLVEDVLDRFAKACRLACSWGAESVYLSFLQPNDLVPETRNEEQRISLLNDMASTARMFEIAVHLCNEDKTLAGASCHWNLHSGICVDPSRFSLPPRLTEGCGCALMVDPFTANESCSMSCSYCYAGMKDSASRKRNTTRSLPTVK